MSRLFFEELDDALRGFLPPTYRAYASRRSSRNLKVWYGEEGREHYEVQLVRTEEGPALEVGFHAEHGDAGRNQDVLDRLTGAPGWRKALGRGAEAGPFLDRPTGTWRRLSEVWDGVDTDAPETAVEAAERLARYIRTLEPARGRGRAIGPERPVARRPRRRG